MSPLPALRDGVRRVNRAPLLVIGMFLVTLLVALPLAIALAGMIEAHLGASLAGASAAGGVDYDWWQEFSAQASGLGTTFVPGIIGFGAVLQNLSDVLDNVPAAATIAGAAAAWLVIWSFLSGGIIDRLARARKLRSAAFFAACGVYFWRFLRLGIIAWLVYATLFGYVHEWIFQDGVARFTRDVHVERTGFLIRLGGYAIFGALLVACSLLFDYARIRMVVEDRRSAIGALLASGRFAWRHLGAVLGLYFLNALLFAVLLALYALAAPGAPRGFLSTILVLVIGETYILARHYLKLVFYASQTAFFQGALAHASYTAAPPVLWPDSPAAESIANASEGRVP